MPSTVVALWNAFRLPLFLRCRSFVRTYITWVCRYATSVKTISVLAPSLSYPYWVPQTPLAPSYDGLLARKYVPKMFTHFIADVWRTTIEQEKEREGCIFYANVCLCFIKEKKSYDRPKRYNALRLRYTMSAKEKQHSSRCMSQKKNTI